jgi:hypothetical protein
MTDQNKVEIPKLNIKINPTTIQFIDYSGNIVYCIWEEDYEFVIEAITKSRIYKEELKLIDDKYWS